MIGKVFKAYDVRAVYPKPLNEKIAWQVGHARAAYLLQRGGRLGTPRSDGPDRSSSAGTCGRVPRICATPWCRECGTPGLG